MTSERTVWHAPALLRTEWGVTRAGTWLTFFVNRRRQRRSSDSLRLHVALATTCASRTLPLREIDPVRCIVASPSAEI